ncbi:hypothetical protein FisN_22Lh216 [Fistulifera solaris]|uniref:AGC-kinase C-terminal domain-containing protein n=1 Tax=Fistulifera solaris TaxID=1519565 RepID=A0A1Z5JC43_FISSO|nr:hypothetical protein FisN_22Lh216 [Fistulifera solaris]|eukprot:GAX11526.1 hypothetical protein FisN_22Lh216 [Fistulifera solaris]
MITINLLCFFVLFSDLEAFVPISQRPSFLVATELYSACDKDNFKGSFTFVEGSDFFASEEEEIEAMGGDPSFLDSSDQDTAWLIPKHEKSDSKEQLDNKPEKFEWDGEVDEDAYFD